MKTIKGKKAKAELDKRTGIYRFETKFRLPVSLVMPAYDSVMAPEGANTILTVYLHFVSGEIRKQKHSKGHYRYCR